MINKVNVENYSALQNLNQQKQKAETNPITRDRDIIFKDTNRALFQPNFQGDSLRLALQILPTIPLSKTISFKGDEALIEKLRNSTKGVKVCADEEQGIAGETVGHRIYINDIINKYKDAVPDYDDVIKTTVEIAKDSKSVTRARTQVKRKENNCIFFEMAVREPIGIKEKDRRTVTLPQKIGMTLLPTDDLKEKVYIFNTKGKLTTVVEDGKNVILTNSGKITNKNDDTLTIVCEKADHKNEFEAFTPSMPIVTKLKPSSSSGKGGELIIGMQEGRFCPEIIESIKDFEEKINNEEIILPQFIAKKGAEKIQIAMLAGGFGSRAEYTNASSDGIFHGIKDGAQSTKGTFRLPTGLTTMETTFISLHMAGILDCSKGKFGIGENVKFYLNKNQENKGNGGFTLDLHKKTSDAKKSCEFIFPNDAISRMPKAVSKAADLMSEGHTAIAMIAKKIPAQSAIGTFGIMKIDDDNTILEFAEKPKLIKKGFADKDCNCLANTFQFAVSRQAFEALDLLEPYFSPALKGKDTRDWSKHLIPTIMVLSQFDTVDKMKEQLIKIVGEENNPEYINFLEGIPDEILLEAKDLLEGQKVVAVPTDEDWADVGNLSSLYKTIIEIAKDNFKLLDWERRNVLNSINPKKGLVAMTSAQKADIEHKYDIKGEVLIVPKAKKIDSKIMDKYEKYTIVNDKYQKS